ncbi:MAG: glycosidase, partial [bacterium]|nr:glycosidase [bacterium]
LYMTYVVTPTPAPPGAVRRRLGIPKPAQAYTRTAVAVVKDFNEFNRLGVITPYKAKERDTVLFPEKIDGKYAVLHRPSNWIGPDYGTDRPGIWFAYLDSLDGKMFGHKLVMIPREKWESDKIGAGPPPIKTERGWLLIYHGVSKDYVYRAGAALLDLEEPWKVIARTHEPILEPEEDYERAGDVPNVVFPEGAVVISNELLLFYGAADKVCCVARVLLKELINYLITIAGR